jgi:hypothetical protein
MIKYLSPWRWWYKNTLARFCIGNDQVFICIDQCHNEYRTNGLAAFFSPMKNGKYVFNTMTEAKKYVDDVLIKNHYTLLTEEQYNKVKVLF